MRIEKSEIAAISEEKSSWAIDPIESLGKLSAIFLGTIYLCGFLTLNSHLYKYGVVELGIASTEYLIAGAMFVLYLVVYGLFAGRGIVMLQHVLGQQIDYLRESGAPPISSLAAFIHSLIELVFFHCLSAGLFSVFAFTRIESFGFYAVLSIIAVISYLMDVLDWDIKYPFPFLIIDSFIKLFAIFSFFYLSTGSDINVVFAAFFCYTFYINLVFDSFQRYRLTGESLIFNLCYTGVFFIISATSFGSAIYGNISKKVGGGKPIEMTMGILPNNLSQYPRELRPPIVGDVVYLSTEYVYIKFEANTLVIPRSSIQWMSFQESDDRDFGDYIKKARALVNGEG